MIMCDRGHRLKQQAGVTVVELVVVCVVIAVLAGFALMQRGSANEQFQRQNVAYELKFAFERARFDSVKRRAADGEPEASVTVTPTSYTLRTYNSDGTASDRVTTVPSGVVIARYDGTTLSSFLVSFDMRGETAASPAPQFYVCNIACDQPTNANANIVLITATGTVNLLPGGASPQSFTPPTVAPPIGDAANIDLNSWAQLAPTPAP